MKHTTSHEDSIIGISKGLVPSLIEIIQRLDDRIEEQINELSNLAGKLVKLERKVAHGCIDALCKECDQ